MKAPRWALAGKRLSPASAAARISVWTPAVRWGAGLFETVGCDHGLPLHYRHHADRLVHGARLLGWTPPELPEEGDVARLLAREGISGPGVLRVLALRERSRLRVVAWAEHYRPPRRLRREGAWLVPVALPSGPLSGVKSCAHMPVRWARDRALAAGADAALLVDADGAVRESDHANLFAAAAGYVTTPPAPRRCLPGVMRAWCLETLAAAGIAVVERDLTLAELLAGGGAWLTSSLDGVVPVRRIGEVDLPRAEKLLGLLLAAGVPAPGFPPRLE